MDNNGHNFQYFNKKIYPLGKQGSSFFQIYLYLCLHDIKTNIVVISDWN